MGEIPYVEIGGHIFLSFHICMSNREPLRILYASILSLQCPHSMLVRSPFIHLSCGLRPHRGQFSKGLGHHSSHDSLSSFPTHPNLPQVRQTFSKTGIISSSVSTFLGLPLPLLTDRHSSLQLMMCLRSYSSVLPPIYLWQIGQMLTSVSPVTFPHSQWKQYMIRNQFRKYI